MAGRRDTAAHQLDRAVRGGPLPGTAAGARRGHRRGAGGLSMPMSPGTPDADPAATRPAAGARRHARMSVRNRVLFFVTAWLIVLMPFLFWWNTWFGRHLSDPKLNEYLHDTQKPRHIQHALVQIGDR